MNTIYLYHTASAFVGAMGLWNIVYGNHIRAPRLMTLGGFLVGCAMSSFMRWVML